MRRDYHAAQITQSVYSILQSFAKGGGKQPSLEDNLLKFKSPQTPAEQAEAAAKALMAAFGPKYKEEMTHMVDSVKQKAEQEAR